jgi:Lamin Tail Domain
MKQPSKNIRSSVFILIFLFLGLWFARIQSGLAIQAPASFLPVLLNAWPPPTPTPKPGSVLITEILYDSAGVEPDQEWIELYNPGDLPFPMTKIWLGDEETLGGTEGMFRFPDGTLLHGGQIIIIANRASAFVQVYGRVPDFEFVNSDPGVPDLIKDKQWAIGNIELTNNADEVLLRDKSAAVIDGVSWGVNSLLDPPAPRVAAGHTLERRPAFMDTGLAMDWKDQPFPNPWQVDTIPPTPTPTARPTNTPYTPTTPTASLTAPPFGGERLLITEVLYFPLGANPEEEWFEIYNAGSGLANLYEYKIGDEETTGQGEGMLRFPPGSILPGGEIMVIANQAVRFYSKYGFYPDFELVNTVGSVPDLIAYGEWSSGGINLSQAEDELLLLNKDDQVQDGLSWGGSTWAFIPGIPEVLQGHSLARIPANQDTDRASDWFDQAQPGPRQIDLALPTPTPTPSPTTTPSPTPTATPEPTPAHAGRLLFSEVMIESDGMRSDYEWLELANVGGQILDLTGYQVGDEETYGQMEGLFYFPDGTSLGPGEVIVIAKNSAIFSTTYGTAPDFEIIDSDPSVPNLIPNYSWGQGEFNLDLYGDEVLILGPTLEWVDLVTWGDSTFAFDPLLQGPPVGNSLERCPATQDTDSAADWHNQPVPEPGVLCP